MVAVVVLGVSVVGCSPDPEPVPVPSSSTSAPSASGPSSSEPRVESSPSPEALTPPVLPAAATTPDAAGAEAFVRHFWDTVNYAYATGDTAAILAISEPGCVGCIGLKDGVESATSTGGRWVDFAWTTEQYLSEPPNEGGLSLVTGLMLLLSADPHVIEADGQRQEIGGQRGKSFQVLALWQDQRWYIYAIDYPDEA